MFAGFGAIKNAKFYCRSKNFSRARKELEQALKWGADYHVIYNNLAYTIARQGKDLDYALKLAEVAISRKPNNAFYSDTYGWLLTLRGRFKQGQKYLIEAAKKKPANIAIMFHLGYSYMKTGDVNKGKQLLATCYNRRNRFLFSNDEWSVISSFFDKEEDGLFDLRSRIKQLNEVMNLGKTASRFFSFHFYFFLITILWIVLALGTFEIYAMFTVVINDLTNTNTATSWGSPTTYTLVFQIYFFLCAILSIVAWKVFVTIIDFLDPTSTAFHK
jgi:tetratricopeptide (TPR) repeat protein